MTTLKAWHRAAAGLALLGGYGLCGCQAPPAPVEPTAEVLLIPDYEAFVDRTLTTLRRYDLPPDYVDRSRGLIVSKPTTSGQWFEFWRHDAQGRYNRLESSLHTIARTVTIRLEPTTPGATGRPPTLGLFAPVGPDDDQSGDYDRLRGQPSTLVIEPRSLTPEPAPTAPPTAAPTAAPPAAPWLPPATPTGPADAWGAPRVMPSAGTFLVSVEVEKRRYSAPERQVTTASGALAIYNERIPTTEGLRRADSRGAHWVSLGRDGLLEAYLLGKLIAASPEVDVVEPSVR